MTFWVSTLFWLPSTSTFKVTYFHLMPDSSKGVESLTLLAPLLLSLSLGSEIFQELSFA